MDPERKSLTHNAVRMSGLSISRIRRLWKTDFRYQLRMTKGEASFFLLKQFAAETEGHSEWLGAWRVFAFLVCLDTLLLVDEFG